MPSLLSAVASLFSDSPTAKGIRGEVTASIILSTLPKDQYHIFNDVTLHTPDSSTTQIDHVIISNYGIFVIEVKNYSGWIFGSETQYKWTQSLPNNNKNQFLNPLIQNKKHVDAVQKALRVEPHEIFSLIVFMDKATFKTEMPDNVVTLSQMRTAINEHILSHFTQQKCETLKKRLEMRMLSKANAQAVHMANIKKKKQQYQEKQQQKQQQSNTAKICPQCHHTMVKRVAKKGKNIGNEFYGCSNFPNCRHIENIDNN